MAGSEGIPQDGLLGDFQRINSLASLDFDIHSLVWKLPGTHLPGPSGVTMMPALREGAHGKESNHKRDQGVKPNPINHSLGPSLQTQTGASLRLVTKSSQSKTGSVLLGTLSCGVPRSTAFILQCVAHHTSCSTASPHC